MALLADARSVRVTVASGDRRVDLVVPSGVPVGELVPELARSVGLLDAATAHGGYRLLLTDGHQLATDMGLLQQGVEDGRILTLTAVVDESAGRVYDDAAEAMADVVERDLSPWGPAAGRRTTLAASCLLLVVGAGALLVAARPFSGAVATSVAAVLIGGVALLDRGGTEPLAALAASWTAELYAAVAGLVFGLARSGSLMIPVAWAGVGAALAGLLCVLALRTRRALALPGMLTGAVAIAVGLLLAAFDGEPRVVLPVVLAVVLVVLVLGGSVVPRLALTLASTDFRRLRVGAVGVDGMGIDGVEAGEIDADEVDAVRMAADVRTAHEILLAMSATAGVVLVLAAPTVAGLGVPGAAVAVVACLVSMLRTRHHRAADEILLGLAAGLLGLVLVAVTLIRLHPCQAPETAAALALGGGVLLALTRVDTASARRSRIADLVETAGLVALLPLLVLAVGQHVLPFR